MMKRATQGQSTVEYVVVVAVVIAALLATTVYMKRGKMGDLGRATDQVGAQFNPHQYSGAFRDKFVSKRLDDRLNNGNAASQVVRAGGELQRRKGNENLTQSRVGCEQLFSQTAGDAPPDLTNCPEAEAPTEPKDVSTVPAAIAYQPGLMVGD